jgi:molybdate transport system ATP-binding protein
MATVTLQRLSVPLRAFELQLSLEVASTFALVGPSGAGKSTVLGAIAGLVKPAAGRISCDDEVWFDAEQGVFVWPERRRVGLVFQEYALFPHLTVRQNIEYARRHPADEYLDRFQIAHLEHARPGSLSGGERQRVALARALARDPEILLLDEPLSALDAHTKIDVRAELQQLLAGLEIPALLVTHDFEDAAALADRVGVIVEGRIRQTGTPTDLVAQPTHSSPRSPAPTSSTASGASPAWEWRACASTTARSSRPPTMATETERSCSRSIPGTSRSRPLVRTTRP